MLTKLHDDGLLNQIEVKTDAFKVGEYAKKLPIKEENIFIERPKTSIYYFNVDLKFILKARMHQLSKEFDKKIAEGRDDHRYKCDQCRDGDSNQYTEVVANSMQMKCNNCNCDLVLVAEENKLSEEDHKKCRS